MTVPVQGAPGSDSPRAVQRHLSFVSGLAADARGQRAQRHARSAQTQLAVFLQALQQWRRMPPATSFRHKRSSCNASPLSAATVSSVQPGQDACRRRRLAVNSLSCARHTPSSKLPVPAACTISGAALTLHVEAVRFGCAVGHEAGVPDLAIRDAQLVELHIDVGMAAAVRIEIDVRFERMQVHAPVPELRAAHPRQHERDCAYRRAVRPLARSWPWAPRLQQGQIGDVDGKVQIGLRADAPVGLEVSVPELQVHLLQQPLVAVQRDAAWPPALRPRT